MERRQHILSPNQGSEVPHRVVFFDVETTPIQVEADTEEHILKLGYAKLTRYEKRKGQERVYEIGFHFNQVSTFWNWLDRQVTQKSRVWVFAHNLAFDFQVMRGFGELKARGWSIKSIISENPPTILTFTHEQRTLKFVDTLNYWPVSLATLGAEIGLPKLPMPQNDASLDAWYAYAERDVEIIATAVLALRDFVLRYDFGNLQATAASQAFTAYRHRFMQTPIYIHDRAKALSLEREAYYGGRVECFRVGHIQEPMYMVDVNSLYPAVMAAFIFPVKLAHPLRGGLAELERLDWPHQTAVAKVWLKTKHPVYPKRYQGRLIFPVGEFETVLCGAELLQATVNKHITDVVEGNVYLTAPLFREYVEEFYALRQMFTDDGNPLFATMCKLFMNALYGKFGQRGIRWVEREWNGEIPAPTWEYFNVATNERQTWRIVAGVTQVKERDSESFDSFPAIAAHVTGFGRMMLWGLMEKVGLSNVYYVDTDSLVINAQGYAKLADGVNPRKLGALKLEWQGSEAVFYTPKDYQLGDKKVCKGIRPNAVEITPTVFEQDMFIGFNGLWRTGQVDRQLVRRVIKRLNRQYEKGTVLPNGWVNPLRFKNNELQLEQ